MIKMQPLKNKKTQNNIKEVERLIDINGFKPFVNWLEDYEEIKLFDYKNEPYWLDIEDIELWTKSTYTINPLQKETRDWNEDDREKILQGFDKLIKWASSCEGQEYEHLTIMKEYFLHIDKPNREDRDKNLVILYDKSHNIIDLYDINHVKEHYFESYLTWLKNHHNNENNVFDKIDNLLSNNTYSR